MCRRVRDGAARSGYSGTVNANPDYVSLLIRLWREPAAERQAAGAAQSKWLVQVEHIPSGEKRYFNSLEELFKFIAGFSQKPRSENDEENLQTRL